MKRRLTGKIVSNKMDKTLVVAVDRVKEHRLYKKKFTITNKFKVHVEDERMDQLFVLMRTLVSLLTPTNNLEVQESLVL
jgi:hypothetical protein